MDDITEGVHKLFFDFSQFIKVRVQVFKLVIERWKKANLIINLIVSDIFQLAVWIFFYDFTNRLIKKI